MLAQEFPPIVRQAKRQDSGVNLPEILEPWCIEPDSRKPVWFEAGHSGHNGNTPVFDQVCPPRSLRHKAFGLADTADTPDTVDFQGGDGSGAMQMRDLVDFHLGKSGQFGGNIILQSDSSEMHSHYPSNPLIVCRKLGNEGLISLQNRIWFFSLSCRLNPVQALSNKNQTCTG